MSGIDCLNEPELHPVASDSGDAIIDSIVEPLTAMAQLIVRNLPEDLVEALKIRAARHRRSAEQEHREILKAALRGPRKLTVAEVLSSMPNVGRDEDFARQQADDREPEL